MRILLDTTLAAAHPELVAALDRAGHAVEKGRVGTKASAGAATIKPEQLAALLPFDVVIVTAAALAEQLHALAPTLAVIVFTKPGDVEARVRALEGGAADAMDPSFSLSQSVARIGAAGRRAALMPRPAERVELGGCVIDLRACTAERDGKLHVLTPREVALVRWFARHPGRVVSRAELLEHVWEVSPRNDTRAVDVAIAGLRVKIEAVPSAPAILISIKGAGYRWG